jgi:outer membrane protein insertion porin family
MRRGSTARAAVTIVIALSAWAASAGIFVSNAIAQRGPATITEIRVVGTNRIDPSTVNSYVQIQPGDAYDAARIDASLKSLFNTGLFADVTLRREGNALIIQVVENPIINRIAFEGNQKLDDEVLDAEVSLRARVVYTRTKVQNDVKRLLDIYRRSGRFGATVEPKVIQLPENRVDLVFEIDEGPSTGIRAINFIGNKQFSDGTLRDVIQTDESAFYRFLTSNDTYDPDRLSFDRELLRRFYLSEGYADFRGVSAIAELTEDREDFVITFTVEEGPEYRFGKIAVTSRLRNIEPAELESLVVGDEGDQYNADEVEQTVQSLTSNLGGRGFAFVDVRPRVNRDREQRTLDVTYEISEGPRVFVERIDISGNIRTLDEVIRREFTIAEGDAFNTARIRATRQRLNNLNFFSRVDITNDPGSAPDRTVINVAVEEQSTGELSLGAGFSSTSGPLGDISIRERNLLGRGQDLRLGLSLGTEQQRIDLSFTEPYFLDRNLAAGIDLFIRSTDLTDESSFEEDEAGFGLRMGYQLDPNIRHTVRYLLSRQEINNVDEEASIVVKSQTDQVTKSSITNDFFLDRLNRRFDPTDGYFGSLNVEMAGVGGTEQFMRTEVSTGYFTPLFRSSVIASLSGEAGYVFTFDDDIVRLTDRFFLGGNSLRGFENAGIGPRDLVTDDAIGGNQFYAGTAELTFPLGLPEEFDIKGSVFTDFGSVWDIEDPFPNLVDDASLRASLGVGLGWVSPFGPIRVDFASALLKEDYDQTKAFSFNFGTRF